MLSNLKNGFGQITRKPFSLYDIKFLEPPPSKIKPNPPCKSHKIYLNIMPLIDTQLGSINMKFI